MLDRKLKNCRATVSLLFIAMCLESFWSSPALADAAIYSNGDSIPYWLQVKWRPDSLYIPDDVSPIQSERARREWTRDKPSIVASMFEPTELALRFGPQASFSLAVDLRVKERRGSLGNFFGSRFARTPSGEKFDLTQTMSIAEMTPKTCYGAHDEGHVAPLTACPTIVAVKIDRPGRPEVYFYMPQYLGLVRMELEL